MGQTPNFSPQCHLLPGRDHALAIVPFVVDGGIVNTKLIKRLRHGTPVVPLNAPAIAQSRDKFTLEKRYACSNRHDSTSC
ncbi:MAG: hypothetical protein A2040_02555 [Rhodocyclales bacterium GWA2_65_19]|nr:MAG: hypothetical protein A2040_02555 [Rhodocyclales bacterium GWA2_65_19]